MFTNVDCDHWLVKKVEEFVKKEHKSYHLETKEERELAKLLVDREFLYFVTDYEHVAPRDMRKYSLSQTPVTSEKKKKSVKWDV